MDKYDFDEIIDRKNTNSLKYDFAVERGLPEDVLPLWVADMDFRTAEPVLQALHGAVGHGIFGYSEVKSDYYAATAAWFEKRFSYKTEEKWLVKTPGVVFALATAVRAFTSPGDAVIIQPPVYYPFFSVIRDNGRVIVENALVLRDGRYEIDFDDFEKKIVSGKVKMFILCSPHNPVGRVWTRDELERVGAICEKHDVIVVSDEIHCDFAFEEHPHTVFSLACPNLAERSIICTSPSKTFNLAGLQISNIWIQNARLRRQFIKEINKTGYSQLNSLGLVAAKAAYTGGGDWHEQCKAYLCANLDFLRRYLEENLPEIRLVEPEGTYFAWLDFSRLGLGASELDAFVRNKAKLWLDSGHIFGGESDCFQRVVLACPKATLRQALDRLASAARGMDR